MPLAAIVAAVEALLGLLGLLRSAKKSALPACHELGSATAADADAQALDAIRAALRDVPDLGERVNEHIIAHPALGDVRAALGRSSNTTPTALDDTQPPAIRAALRDVPDLGERVNEHIIAHPALGDVRAALGRSSNTTPTALDDTQPPDDASGDGEEPAS